MDENKNLRKLFDRWLQKQEHHKTTLNPYYPRMGGEKFFTTGYKLREKYMANDVDHGLEDFYITGADLFDAFCAGFKQKEDK